MLKSTPRYSSDRAVRDTSKVFQKGKVVIPVDVRESLGVVDGDIVLWVYENGRWHIEKAQ